MFRYTETIEEIATRVDDVIDLTTDEVIDLTTEEEDTTASVNSESPTYTPSSPPVSWHSPVSPTPWHYTVSSTPWPEVLRNTPDSSLQNSIWLPSNSPIYSGYSPSPISPSGYLNGTISPPLSIFSSSPNGCLAPENVTVTK